MQAIEEVILAKDSMRVGDCFTVERVKELEREKSILTLKIEQFEKQRCRKDACPYLDNEPVLKVKAERNYLRKEVDKLMNLMDFATQKIRNLDAECNRLKKQLYGSKTERQKIEESKNIPNGIDKGEAKRERGAQHGHQGHGRKIPLNLPVVEEIHELPEEERCCQRCGLPFEELPATEDSYEIGVRRTYFLKRNRRRKYKRTCSCPNPIITAHLPPKVIPKGKFDISFWIKVILDKYLFQLPLQRQVFQMKLLGLNVSKGTLVNGLKKLYGYLLPLYNLFGEEIRAANHWHADETGWFIFIEAEDKKDFKWWLWVVVTKEIVYYTIDKSRSGEVIKGVLGENSSGIANVDRYTGYKNCSLALFSRLL
jgi:transposase